jgi:hypothetical protein
MSLLDYKRGVAAARPRKRLGSGRKTQRKQKNIASVTASASNPVRKRQNYTKIFVKKRLQR